jgi:hypothetical protein
MFYLHICPFVRRGAPRPHANVLMAYEMTMLPFAFPSLKPLMYGTYISGSSSTSGWQFITGDGQELRTAGVLAQPPAMCDWRTPWAGRCCTSQPAPTMGGPPPPLGCCRVPVATAAAPRVMPHSCGHRRRPPGARAHRWPATAASRDQHPRPAARPVGSSSPEAGGRPVG